MTDKINCVIIYLLLNTIVYNKYYNYIDILSIKNNNKLLYKLFLCIEKLHQTSVKDHTVEELILLFKTEYPVLSKDESLLFPQLVEELNTVSISTDESVVIGYFESLRERQLAEKLALSALDLSQGRASKEDVEAITKELFTNFVKPDEKLFLECDIDTAVSSYVGSVGLRWRLRSLNQALGSLRKGNFGFVFARPETGKTTFLASEVTYFLQQLERPVLWVNNEEPSQQIIFRCYQAALGRSREWILKNLEEAKSEYTRLVGDRLKFVDTANANRKDVERICRELQPGVIVFDQLDKLGGFSADRYDLLQKGIYQWARELAKEYGPVIGVCQAGGTAENKRYLDMNDVDSSHTAKQGEADWVLGIGMTHNDNDQFKRFLSICKNKLPGDEDSVPEMRHAKMEVGINPFIARYEG